MTFSSHDSHLSPAGTRFSVTSSLFELDGISFVKCSVVFANASRNVASRKSGLISSMTQTLLQFGHFIVPPSFIRLTQPLQNTCSHGKTCGSVKNSVQITQFVNSSTLVAILIKNGYVPAFLSEHSTCNVVSVYSARDKSRLFTSRGSIDRIVTCYY